MTSLNGFKDIQMPYWLWSLTIFLIQRSCFSYIWIPVLKGGPWGQFTPPAYPPIEGSRVEPKIFQFFLCWSDTPAINLLNQLKQCNEIQTSTQIVQNRIELCNFSHVMHKKGMIGSSRYNPNFDPVLWILVEELIITLVSGSFKCVSISRIADSQTSQLLCCLFRARDDESLHILIF